MLELKTISKTLAKVAIRLLLGVVLLVSLVLIGHLAGIGSELSIVAGIVVTGIIVWKGSIRVTAVSTLILIMFSFGWHLGLTPRNDRDWVEEASILPRIELDGPRMTVVNLRDFRWETKRDYEAAWIRQEFDLESLESMDLIIEPFGESQFAAHVMLRFRFSQGQSLVVSVEARREKGEGYGLLAGAARQFELIYVFASESDIVDLRAIHRGSRVYAFPLRVKIAFMRSLLESLASSANDLHQQPQFYATIRDNCTTTLLRHSDRLIKSPIGLRYEVLFPAKAGELIHRLGLMDTTLTYDEAKQRYRIDKGHDGR